LKLRRIFRAIQAIKSQSGWTWSDTKGADIAPEMEQEWSKFVKIYKEAKPFKSSGWVHLEKMAEIMPVTLRGLYVFRPSQGLTGLDTAVRLPRSPSPDWDLEPEGAEVTEVLPTDRVDLEVSFMFILLCLCNDTDLLI
jgi:hypothetical protein